jgi:hypothetical protein
MAFTPEDGTGLPNANSYIDVAFADTYHADRNQTDWTDLSTDAKQGFLVRATDYIDKRFGKKFRGFRQQKSQALEWPRLDAFDNDEYLLDGIPSQLQKACAEYALRAITNSELAPDNTNTGVQAFTRRIGPIELKDELSTTVPSTLLSPQSINDYPEADLWIGELLKSGESRDLGRA